MLILKYMDDQNQNISSNQSEQGSVVEGNTNPVLSDDFSKGISELSDSSPSIEAEFSPPPLEEEITKPEVLEPTPNSFGSEISEVTSEPSPDNKTISPPVSPPTSSKLSRILLIFGGIIFVLGLAFLVFKFVFPQIRKSEEVALTYWGLWEPEEVMRGVIMEWEREHPNIKINYSRQNQKEYRERLQSALARDEGPDIFRFHITWVPMLKNELEPIPSSIMSASQFQQVFYPVVSDNLRIGDSYVGIPLMIDTLALYYNEDIFRVAGENPPTTWDELRELAIKLTVKDEDGRIQTAGVALGITDNIDHWSDILGLMMLQNRADLANPSMCVTQAGEEVCLGVDALTYYSIFNLNDHVWDETLPSSTQAFAAGKLAMYFGPSWRVFDIKALNPNLNFKIAPVPQLQGANINWASFWVEGVAKKSKHKDKAWKFLEFLSSPQTLEKLYQAQSNLRVFGEIYPRVEMAEKLKANSLVAPFLAQASTAQTWYLCSYTWDNGINTRMIKYFEDAVNAVNSGRSAKEALQTASQGISQLLSQYGITSPVVR